MFCLQCGAANPDDASVCAQCNQTIAPVSHLPGAPPASALPSQPPFVPVYQPPLARPKSPAVSVVCVAGAALILWLMAWLHAPRSLLGEILWPQGVGFAFGGFLVAVTISFLGFGRYKNWHGFARCLVAVIAIGFVLTIGSDPPHRYDLNAAIIKLARQASGAEPPTDRTPAEKAFREFFVEVFSKRKAYEAKAQSFQGSPEIQTLLKPASYRSMESIEAVKRQLDLMVDTDAEMKRYIDVGMVQSAMHAAETLQWRPGEKEDFLTGMQNSLNLSVYSNSFDTEIQWLTGCREIYSMAESNFSYFRVDGDSVMIADEGFRQKFNAQIEHVNQLRVAMNDARTAAMNKQQSTRSKLGASESDLGIK